MQSLSALDDNLRALRPGEDWGGSERFDGEQGLGLGDGTGVLQDLADLDDLSEQLSQSYNGSRMDDVDLDKLARQLGDEASVDARTLAELEKALRDSGYLKRTSDGQLRLSPKAMRQLGKALLRDVAQRMSGRQGNRDMHHAGAAGERSGATPRVGVRRHRAVGRHPHGDQRRRTQRRGGRGHHARRTARDRRRRGDGDRGPHPGGGRAAGRHVVLDGDGRPLGADEAHRAGAAPPGAVSRFRGDALQLIGFGRHAEVMEIEQLTALDAMWDKGTNLHHALLLANRHFRKHPTRSRCC